MGEKSEDGLWRITGMLNWDDACALPPVLAFRSLEWMRSGLLYDDEELAFQWTGNLDFVPQRPLDALPNDC